VKQYHWKFENAHADTLTVNRLGYGVMEKDREL